MPDAQAAGYGLSITREQSEVLARFAELIRHWNRFANLVSRRDERRIEERHVRDSLSLVAVLLEVAAGSLKVAAGSSTVAAGSETPADPVRIADVGSGAGLPGIPLAVVLPGAHVTLIERSAKKSRFLQQAIMQLGLPNADVVCDDVADVVGKFDVVVARAVMAPERLWPLVQKNLDAGGHMVVLDRVQHPDAGPPADSIGDFPGGSIVQRTWSHNPESGALHGVLVVRCEAS